MNKDLLLINKPKGLTSFDVIRVLRKKLSIRKIGHGGSLDPIATGLLIVGVDKGTKKLSRIIKMDKKYQAEVMFGIHTDTYDIDGSILQKYEGEILLNKDKINEALQLLMGEREYEVPLFSAKKMNGVRLYELARKNLKPSNLPTKVMKVYSVQLLDIFFITYLNRRFPVAQIKFHVSSGTYVRTLAVELGKLLGYPATLYSLVRTNIGPYSLDDAIDLDSEKLSLCCN